MPVKRGFGIRKSGRVFGQGQKAAKTIRAGLYARVSTQDQQTLPMQNRAMREYAARRGWTITMQVKEVGSGAAQRQRREGVMEAARRREIDVVVVWRLDRWGRSVTDLLATLEELEHLGVGFVSLTEALDLTTPAGRAMAALLAVFAANAEGAKSLASACGLDWPMPSRTANAWADPFPPPSTPIISANSAAPASANPRSPAVSTSAALRCAVS